MTPSAVAVVVVANTHLASLRVQDVSAMTCGVHPCVDDLFRRDAAPCGILTGGGIGDTVVLQDGEALGTIGTDVGVHNGDLLGAGLCSGGQVVIAHFQSSQAVLCTLSVDQIQNFLTVIFSVGIFGVREDQHPVIIVGAAFVVANTHSSSIGVQDTLAGKIGSHPLIHCGIGG